MSDELDIDEAAEGVFYFNGTKLEPFSWKRNAAFDRFHVPGSSLENACLLVYLCTLSRNEIEAAYEYPESFKDDLEKWGDKHRIYVGTPSRDVVMKIALKILESVKVSEAQPEIADSKSPPREK